MWHERRSGCIKWVTAMKKQQTSLRVLTAHLLEVRLNQPSVTLREAQQQAQRVMAAALHSPLRFRQSSTPSVNGVSRTQ